MSKYTSYNADVICTLTLTDDQSVAIYRETSKSSGEDLVSVKLTDKLHSSGKLYYVLPWPNACNQKYVNKDKLLNSTAGSVVIKWKEGENASLKHSSDMKAAHAAKKLGVTGDESATSKAPKSIKNLEEAKKYLSAEEVEELNMYVEAVKSLLATATKNRDKANAANVAKTKATTTIEEASKTMSHEELIALVEAAYAKKNKKSDD